MTIVSNTSEMFPAPGATSSKANSMTDMGADDFLTLMVAQLQHQDPTKPMDNTEFVAQLAQFSTSTGVQELNESFSDLSSSLASPTDDLIVYPPVDPAPSVTRIE